MHRTDLTDREDEWIAKYRAALGALSVQQPPSQALGSFWDGVRTYLQWASRATLARIKHSTKALEAGKLEPKQK
jgi:hypothetical protein